MHFRAAYSYSKHNTMKSIDPAGEIAQTKSRPRFVHCFENGRLCRDRPNSDTRGRCARFRGAGPRSRATAAEDRARCPPFVHPHEQATEQGPKIVEFRLTAEEKQIV